MARTRSSNPTKRAARSSSAQGSSVTNKRGSSRSRSRGPGVKKPAGVISEKVQVKKKKKRVTVPKAGFSLAPEIFAQDDSHVLQKVAVIGLAVVSMTALPFIPGMVHKVIQDGDMNRSQGFDADHGINADFEGLWTLLQHGLGLKFAQIEYAIMLTGAFFTTLFALDLLSIVFPETIQWPDFMDTHNTLCYRDMFSEPSFNSNLVRRKGNTASNFVYLFTAICVLLSGLSEINSASSSRNQFWVPDTIFGVMLLILAILSVVWHASNCPKSQYIDLWSMDSCIAYLIVRFLSMGLVAHPAMASYAPLVCTGLFGVVIAGNGWHHYNRHLEEYLDGSCPFSGRVRLKNNGKPGNIDMTVISASLFLGMPVLFMVVPFFVQVFLLKTMGSFLAATSCVGSLVIGWTWRFFERFCLDGFAPINALHRWQSSLDKWEKKRRMSGGALVQVTYVLGTFCLTFAAAFMSPTAALHFFTGITLLAGYLHVRSIDVHFGTA